MFSMLGEFYRIDETLKALEEETHGADCFPHSGQEP